MISEPQFVLVKYSGDWADEMDIKGFRALTEEQWWRMQQRINDPENYPMECHVGSNQVIEYDSPEQLLSDLKTDIISRDEFNVVSRLFRKYSTIEFGFFPEI